MNSLFTKTALTVTLSAGLILSSCQDKEAIAPAQETLRTDSGARIAGLPAPNYPLLKDGSEFLSYYNDGFLKEVKYTNSEADYGIEELRVEYSYGDGWVSATRYEGSFKKRKMTWQIVNGRATELETEHYKIGSGAFPYLYTHAKYEYVNNRLSKIISTDPEKSIINFSYDGFGNVSQFLWTKGTGKKLEVINLTKFEYSEYVGGPLSMDKNALANTHVFGGKGLKHLGDPYLPIFGKFGTNLVKRLYPSGPALKFVHVFDTKGNVAEQKIYNLNGPLVKTKQFAYKYY
jgi:hypothetical protein